MKAIVIGAGVGGLATALRLKSKGAEVHVYEANAYPGGKLTAFEQDGYRFDAGPSLFTLPQLVDELFVVNGKNPRDYYNYQKLPITGNYFFEDGTNVTAFADLEKFEKEVERKLNVSGKIIREYLSHRKEIYNTASSIFLENSLHRWQTWWSAKVMKALVKIPSLGIFKTMNEENIASVKHPKLVQLFNRYGTYNGSNPYEAPGILTSIPHLEMNLGAYLPKGGMHEITQSLYQLALDLGIEFHFNQRVDEIIIEQKKATGIRAGGKELKSDVVISNMDVFHTYRKLLQTQPAPEKILAQERSSSALIFYWGIKKSFPKLDLHNLLFAENYEAEFDSIFKAKTTYHDPTVYINITSKYCQNDAPTGCENWFVMINVPANQNHPWEEWIPTARQAILTKLKRMLGEDITPLIETESVLDPRTIESKTSSYQGSLYGTSSNNRFAAFLRHPNFSRKFQNLYFCGGSAHPGGGIPLALLSGKIASELISEQFAL